MMRKMFILVLLATLAYSEDYYFGYELDDIGANATNDIYILGLGTYTTNLTSIPCIHAILFLNGTPTTGSFIYSNKITAFFQGSTSCAFANYTCLLYNASNFTYTYLNTSYSNNRSNFSNVEVPMNYMLLCRLYNTDNSYVETEIRSYSVVGEGIWEGDLVMSEVIGGGILIICGVALIWIATRLKEGEKDERT